MKIIEFSPYDPAVRDAHGRPHASARAWTIAMMAIANAPAGPTAEKAVQVSSVYEQVAALAVSEGDERRLNPQGGFLTLTPEELATLKEAVQTFRPNVTGAQADALVYLDRAIAFAKESVSDA